LKLTAQRKLAILDRKEYQKQYYRKRKEAGIIRKQVYRVRRADNLRLRYGLTEVEVAATISKQSGLCAICRIKPAKVIDHDHSTGKVREVLCTACNLRLGVFESANAAELKYLKRHGSLAPSLFESALC